MPRKTRKQKERQNKPGQDFVKREFSFDLEAIASKTDKSKNAVKSSFSATSGRGQHDLPKSIVLGLSLLGLQLVIYWARQIGLINLP